MTKAQPSPSGRLLDSDASVLAGLSESDSAIVLTAIRKVKNQIIGNKQKKLSYLRQGAIPKVVRLLSKQQAKELRIQAAVALASFSYRSAEGSRELNQQNGVERLLAMLDDEDSDVVAAAARALKMVFQSPLAPVHAATSDPAKGRLVALLLHPTGQVAETVACVLACCWQVREIALSYENTAAMANTIALLLSHIGDWGAPSSPSAAAPLDWSAAGGSQGAWRARRSALEAMSALGGHSQAAREQLLISRRVLEYLVVAIRAPDSKTRLLSCGVLTNVLQMSSAADHVAAASLSFSRPPPGASSSAASGPVPGATSSRGAAPDASSAAILHLQALMLPVLVKLLGEPALRDQVPAVLARLISQHEHLQRAVADSDAMPRLCAFMLAQLQSEAPASSSGEASDAPEPPNDKSGASCALDDGDEAMATDGPSPSSSSAPSSHTPGRACELRRTAEQLEGALSCIAHVSNACERNRVSMCRPLTVSAVTKCLAYRSPGVRCAAANCLRVLTRYASNAKMACFNDAALAAALLGRLKDEDVAVRTEVCLALCNLGQAACSARDRLIEQGVLEQLAELLGAEDETLLGGALWAMSNVVDSCKEEPRQQVMRHVAWPRMRALLTHPSREVGHHAWRLLQNHVKPIRGGEGFVASLFRWCPCAEIVGLLSDVLAGDSAADAAIGARNALPASDVRVVKCAMYVTCNLAAGFPEQKLLIIQSPILKRLPHYLLYTDADAEQAREVRLATAWVVVNLLYLEPRCNDAGGEPDAQQIQIAQMVMQPLQGTKLIETLELLKANEDTELSQQCRSAIAQIKKVRECLEQAPAALAG